MAAGESAVNRASMAQAAQQVEAAFGMITGLQSNMNGYSSQLGGGWQGNAAVAFTRTYEMFSADFAKVLNALQAIHDKLVSTRSTYQATEDANTARVNQVAGLISGGTAMTGRRRQGRRREGRRCRPRWCRREGRYRHRREQRARDASGKQRQ